MFDSLQCFTLYQIHADTCSLQFITGQVIKQKQKVVNKCCLTMYSEPITKYLPNDWVNSHKHLLSLLSLKTKLSDWIRLAHCNDDHTLQHSHRRAREQGAASWNGDGRSVQSRPATKQLCHVRQVTRLCWILVFSSANRGDWIRWPIRFSSVLTLLGCRTLPFPPEDQSLLSEINNQPVG